MNAREQVNDLIAQVKELRVEGVSDLKVAEYVAKEVHSGPSAFDKNGAPYFEHPQRVSKLVTALFSNKSELLLKACAVAWLHDVIEDSQDHFGAQISRGDLQLMHFSDDVIGAVDILSKKDPYDEYLYLDAIANNQLARIVKFADLMDNTSPLRRSGLNLSRRDKYRKYWDQLVYRDEWASS